MNYAVLIFALIYAGCSTPAAAPPALNNASPMIRCTEHPLPEFTVGADQSPSEQEQATLCSCIWSRLSDQERAVADKLYGGKKLRVAASSMDSFASAFGKAFETCTVSAR